MLCIFYYFSPPKVPYNEDAPFSVPPHLRDEHNTFEELQAAGGVASTPTGGMAIKSAEADNLLS